MIEEDFLEVDKPIPGQNYSCISFISPENVLKNKELFLLRKFLNHIVTKDDNKFITDKNEIGESELLEEFENFKFNNEKEVYDAFDEENGFKTSVRSVKVRGVYDTLKEAQIRAKVLQRKDPNFNVFVGQVGYWLPWDPSAEDVTNQEYQENELNDLMHKYKENINSRDELYEKEKQDKQQKAIEENRKRREANDLLRKQEAEAAKLATADTVEDTDGIEESKEHEISGLPTDTAEETTEKLKEFRKILDEKDKVLQDMTDAARDANKANQTNGQVTINDTTTPGSIDDDCQVIELNNNQDVEDTIAESQKNLTDIVNSIF
jgi:hypothetical protein